MTSKFYTLPMLIRYRILISLSLLCTVLPMSGCDDMQTSTPPLRVGTNIWPGYEPLYLAQQLGKWPDQQVRLIEYPSSTQVLRAFRNHSLEGASLTLDEVLKLRQDNIPLQVVLVHDVSTGGDAILARPGIDSIKLLKGKRIGVESGALGAYVITRALENAGLSISDVQIKPFPINLHQTVYLNHDVDAVVTFEPTRTILLNAGAKEIFSSRDIPNEIVDVLVVHEDYIKRHPEVVRSLISGWFDAIGYMHNDMPSASHILSKRQHVTPQQIIDSYAGMHIPTREENQALLGGNPPQLSSTWANLNRILVTHKILRQPIALGTLFNPNQLNDKSQ